MFIKEDNNIYETIDTGTTKGKVLIGENTQVSIIENDTTIVYSWSKFDIDKGEYVADSDNNSPINIDDNTFIPIGGIVTIQKEV